MPQPTHIMKLPVPETESLDDDLQKYIAVCQEKLGLVPNVIKAYTARPDKLRAFSAMYNDLMLSKTKLSKLEREMIAVVVSSVNRCYYCLVAHGRAVRELSGDPQLGEMLVMNYRVAELSPRQRIMLDFAWKLTETPWLVTDADRQQLRDAGFDNEEVFDISVVIGFFNMSNRVAVAVDMMPNPEYHSMDR